MGVWRALRISLLLLYNDLGTLDHVVFWLLFFRVLTSLTATVVDQSTVHFVIRLLLRVHHVVTVPHSISTSSSPPP